MTLPEWLVPFLFLGLAAAVGGVAYVWSRWGKWAGLTVAMTLAFVASLFRRRSVSGPRTVPQTAEDRKAVAAEEATIASANQGVGEARVDPVGYLERRSLPRRGEK